MIRTVVVAPDLFLVLTLRMYNYLGKHLGENVFKQLWGENHLRPIMASLQNVKDVSYKVMTVSKTPSRAERYIPLKSILLSKYAS
jgi:hypothetical protein